MIICKKCEVEKPLIDFYPKSRKCKECTVAAVNANRLSKLEYYREYDRKRGNRQGENYLREYREKYPKKYKAHVIVNNYLRDGKLFKQPCEICGECKSVAHHDDYNKPLDVRWLCQGHHKQWHSLNGEGINSN